GDVICCDQFCFFIDDNDEATDVPSKRARYSGPERYYVVSINPLEGERGKYELHAAFYDGAGFDPNVIDRTFTFRLEDWVCLTARDAQKPATKAYQANREPKKKKSKKPKAGEQLKMFDD